MVHRTGSIPVVPQCNSERITGKGGNDLVCHSFSCLAFNQLRCSCDFNRRQARRSKDGTRQVKSIQPDMNRQKQIRKAVAEINGYLSEKALDKAAFGLHLLNQMLDSIDNGAPRPWSEFQPMLVEEFS